MCGMITVGVHRPLGQEPSSLRACLCTRATTPCRCQHTDYYPRAQQQTSFMPAARMRS